MSLLFDVGHPNNMPLKKLNISWTAKEKKSWQKLYTFAYHAVRKTFKSQFGQVIKFYEFY